MFGATVIVQWITITGRACNLSHEGKAGGGLNTPNLILMQRREVSLCAPLVDRCFETRMRPFYLIHSGQDAAFKVNKWQS